MTAELAGPQTFDDYLAGDADLLLLSAEAVVRAYCGWHIAPSRSDVATLAESFLTSIALPTLYLTEVGTVVEDGTLVAATEYVFNRAGFLSRVSPRRCSWDRTSLPEVVVEFTHGYDEVPADVTAVVLSVAARAAQSPNGVVRRQVGQVSETASQSAFNVAGGVTLLKFEKDVLDPYRILAFA